VDGAEVLLVAKGRSLVRYDLKEHVRDRGQRLARIAGMIGPTGNLRAPTIKRGRMVVVGFHPDALRELLGPLGH
jgi:hypothetical protein